MKLSEVVQSAKTKVVIGTWQNDPPKPKDFPLKRAKGGRLRLTRSYRWIIVSFNIGARQFRILSAYHIKIPNYQSYLAEIVDGDCRVVARLDYHASDPTPGWHVHANCEDFDDLTLGIVKPFGQIRIPNARSFHRNVLYCKVNSMSDNIALQVVLDRFNVHYETDLLGEVVQ